MIIREWRIVDAQFVWAVTLRNEAKVYCKRYMFGLYLIWYQNLVHSLWVLSLYFRRLLGRSSPGIKHGPVRGDFIAGGDDYSLGADFRGRGAGCEEVAATSLMKKKEKKTEISHLHWCYYYYYYFLCSVLASLLFVVEVYWTMSHEWKIICRCSWVFIAILNPKYEVKQELM